MLYEDGGGLTINHPTWTYNQNLFSMDILIKILDIDDIVLGIEIYNGKWDTELWDQILCSGRRCWGFTVPDHYHKSHPVWYGRNVLIVPEKTSYECLKSLRKGNMYCKYANTDLKFTNILLENNTLIVNTNINSNIKAIADGDIYLENFGKTIICPLEGIKTYIRIEASTDEDRILSQPIIFSTQERKNIMGKKYWKQQL